MYTLTPTQPVPTYAPGQHDVAENSPFAIFRSEGDTVYEPELLLPHRKSYYLLVFLRHHVGRHWVDGTLYEHHDDTLYFSTPSQVLVKEDPSPMWGTYLTFTPEFLAGQPNAALRELPLVRNPHNGHELRLSPADVTFVADAVDKLHAEYHRPGAWQQPMLSAHLTVLLTYLSRLYTEQFAEAAPSAERLLLRSYQAQIEVHFRERHEVAAYAELLHLSAGHLSEVVKAQSGKPAIKHIHERLVLEARRLLFHTQHPLKEIAFELGFADSSYFNRFFKRETGLTPAEYRTHIRKMYP